MRLRRDIYRLGRGYINRLWRIVGIWAVSALALFLVLAIALPLALHFAVAVPVLFLVLALVVVMVMAVMCLAAQWCGNQHHRQADGNKSKDFLHCGWGSP